MKQQALVTSYFKSKSQSVNKMDDRQKKKFNLSLTRTPNFSSYSKNQDTCDLNLSVSSNSSGSTVLYTPSPTPGSSSKYFNELSLTCATTTNLTCSGGSPNVQSPSKRTYYSPTKKRNLTMKSPKKVKRNLNFTMDDNNDFIEISKGYNDSTIFLLKIMHNFLQNINLHPFLEQSSIDLLSKMKTVKKPGMQLVCRLYWRQQGWRRLETIEKIFKNREKMDKITLNEILSSLIESGFITACDDNQIIKLDFDELVKMLKLDELKCVCKEFKINNKKTKEDMIESLKNYKAQKTNITKYFNVSKSSNENRLLKVLQSKIQTCYMLSHLARNTLRELHILMYLGIHDMALLDSGLELMLLNEKTQKETFPIHKDMKIDNASVVFNNREEFYSYIIAHSIYASFMEETDPCMRCFTVNRVYNLYKDIDKERMARYLILPEWLHRYTPPYIYIKILEDGIKDLKKDKIETNVTLALEILSTLIEQTSFRQHKKAEWYAEKALILDRLQNKAEEAALLLLEGFRSNIGDMKTDILRPRALLLAKRRTNPITASSKEQLLELATKDDILEKNIFAKHFYKQPMENFTKGKIMFKIRTELGMQILSAEECCKHLYIEEGLYTHGYHWEGAIITTLFALLFWDIIYTQLRCVRGIFLSYYQVYPLDMFSSCFYTNRKTLIDDRLKDIELMSNEHMLATMKSVWDARPECELSAISRSIKWESIASVCSALQAKRVAALCRRLAHHYHHAHSGFPDLTMWNEKTGQVAFVEVKTDSDKPSLKQIQWMHYMKQNDIHTEFCYIGVNTARAKSRNKGLEDL